jgi:NADPH-dependent glutamate synthase beta subunit-like oxidoreductase
VTIEQIEYSIVEKAFSEGWIHPEAPETRTGKKVAVIGSGPSGLACAQQLNRAGHWVTVFERADRIGGLLRYGIPDFKLDKSVIDRRLKILEEEGIVFQPGADIGKNYPTEKMKEFDAVVLCTGSTKPRNLPFPDTRWKESIMRWISFVSRIASWPGTRLRIPNCPDLCRRKTRHRHRRRGYGKRLRGNLESAGRTIGHAD